MITRKRAIVGAAPVHIAIFPSCPPRDPVLVPHLERVRGDAVADIREGIHNPDRLLPNTQMHIWTGPVVIQIGGGAPIPIDEVIAGLRGIGATGSIQTGDPLPPPDPC